jgi:membrane associated rhomboid family serine protease
MDEPAKRQPIFNAPAVVMVLIALFLSIHAGTVLLLDRNAQLQLLLNFAFWPEFMDLPANVAPAPWGRYWTPVSYAFLHGDWLHVGINSLYLLAFGTPVAQRFGTVRFLLLMAVGAVGGAAAHYFTHIGGLVPMIGASASVSAALGAACRFVLTPGPSVAERVQMPARSLVQSLQNRSVLTFVIVWFAINWLFGAGVLAVPGQDAGIAWQAHVGGFLVGFFCFALFDPVRRPAD